MQSASILRRRPLTLLPLALLLASAALASAQTVIDHVPYTISTSGHYTLNGNLNSSAANTPAITISANNVILDLNGYYVAGPGHTAASGTANSTILVGEVASITIRNGLVADDAYGIFFSARAAANSRNYVVESVTLTHCYLSAIFFGGAPAPGSAVRNCLCSLIGSSTAEGIQNYFTIFTAGGVRIENNNLGPVTAPTNGTSFGIYASSTDFSIGNTISGNTYGEWGGKYQNNLTSGCSTPFYAGVDAGGNN